MRGRVILATLVVTGAIGLTALSVPVPVAAGTGTVSSAKPQAAPTRPAPAPSIKAVKILKLNRKLRARLDKCQRRLIGCHEKRDRERNQVTLRDVLGGLGWIVGLCSLALAVAVLWRDYQRRSGA